MLESEILWKYNASIELDKRLWKEGRVLDFTTLIRHNFFYHSPDRYSRQLRLCQGTWKSWLSQWRWITPDYGRFRSYFEWVDNWHIPHITNGWSYVQQIIYKLYFHLLCSYLNFCGHFYAWIGNLWMLLFCSSVQLNKRHPYSEWTATLRNYRTRNWWETSHCAIKKWPSTNWCAFMAQKGNGNYPTQDFGHTFNHC